MKNITLSKKEIDLIFFMADNQLKDWSYQIKHLDIRKNTYKELLIGLQEDIKALKKLTNRLK